ncbi:hypothetical protein [Thermodesulfobacterium sp. TA1]|uniref:hypothetical protein n=1 Tax=Thermodesulfobacterium sp. TA1 TaxID=2234087 RepID=UPI001980FDAE|nr:hypothetical protein [Thermodesulfobacterium sp. TA1]
MAENFSSIRKHRIKIKKPIKILYKEKIVCPNCQNNEEFYEVIENATIFIYYLQNEDGSLEALEEEVEVMGPVKFFCANCNTDLTHLRNK